MKKEIEFKQEELKEIDLSKVKNVPKVEIKEGKLIIEFELTDGK